MPAVTDAYHRRRHLEVQARVTGIDLLNRASMAEAPALRDLRAKALDALYSARPVRQTLMRAGLGCAAAKTLRRIAPEVSCKFAQSCRSAPRTRETLKHVSDCNVCCLRNPQEFRRSPSASPTPHHSSASSQRSSRDFPFRSPMPHFSFTAPTMGQEETNPKEYNMKRIALATALVAASAARCLRSAGSRSLCRRRSSREIMIAGSGRRPVAA